MHIRLSLVLLALCTAPLAAQDGVASHNAILRSSHSSSSDSLAHLVVGDHVSLISTEVLDGYYHVRLTDGKEGWAWKRNITLSTDSLPGGLTPIGQIHTGTGKPGTSTTIGCGDSLWQHVYNPGRLTVFEQCVTISGVMVDATAPQATHRADGVRHEKDGDTHGWIQLDSQYQSLLDTGNMSDEGGNMVFEIVCHFTVTQADAKPACDGFQDHQTLPPVGSHVFITGTYVQDDNHAHWNEIHPVTKIVIH